MKRKITAAILAAAMLVPYTVQAEEWIELSSWSYNEVSGFVSDGLMPELLAGKGNYKQDITRGEFAELVYSVLDKTGMLSSRVNRTPFFDCDGYTGAQVLGSLAIAEGVSDVSKDQKAEFLPKNYITREDAAVLLSRAVKLSFNTGSNYAEYDFTKIQERYDDISELSDYAINPIRYMFQYSIMSGDDENRRFNPKGNLSIEQAVLMVYRYYKALPRMVESDNERVAENSLVQQYDCGINEIYRDNVYYIEEENGKELMSFEADVYSSIICCEYGGERLCFAVNFNDKTDVYNLDTKELKYTIPNIVYEIDAHKGYIYIYSGRFMPVYSGMWSMKGYLEIPPCYSRSELDELIAAAEEKEIEWYPEPVEDTKTAESDGTLYYSDADNGGWLCSVDSNGNNKKVIVRDDCRDLVYINGVIYYMSHKEEFTKLYCIPASGGEPQYICDSGDGTFYAPYTRVFYEDCDEKSLEYYRQLNNSGDISVFTAGMGCYNVLNNGALMYCKAEESGTWKLYEAGITGNGFEKKEISDFPVYGDQVTSAYDGSGRIFFTEFKKMYENGSSPLYMYDGTKTTTISGDYNVINYGFKRGTDGKPERNRIYFTAEELGAGKCAYADLTTGEITVYTPEREVVPWEEYDSFDRTPDNYHIAYKRNGLEIDTNDREIRVIYNGKTKNIPMSMLKKVMGDYIYYITASSYRVIEDSGYSSTAVRKIGQKNLCAYNYKTGESVLVADDYYRDSAGCINSELNDFVPQFGGLNINHENIYNDIFIYNSTSGEYKQVRGTTAVTVFPNKGIHKSGKLYAVGEINRSTWTDGFIYKVDEEGNISALTDNAVNYWMYIPNGEEAPQFACREYSSRWW